MTKTPITDALSVILRQLRIRAKITAHPQLCGPWAVDTSGHRKATFHLIERGNGWLHLFDGRSPPLPLSAGDFVLFPRDANHVISHSQQIPNYSRTHVIRDPDKEEPITSLLCGYFEFHSKAAGPLLDGLDEVIVLDLKEASGLRNTRTLIELMVSELQNQQPGMDVAINELAYLLFIHILRVQMDSGLETGLLRGLADPRIGVALNAIHQDPGADWDIETLSQLAGMSRSSFADHFKSILETTPGKYLTQCRMRHAEGLLQTTKLGMAEIAAQTGYTSEVAFRKAFRGVTGRPPGQARREVISP